MYDTEEGRTAKKLLDALERGGTPIPDLAISSQDIDPVLVHAIVSYVRDVYRIEDSAGYLGRADRASGRRRGLLSSETCLEASLSSSLGSGLRSSH